MIKNNSIFEALTFEVRILKLKLCLASKFCVNFFRYLKTLKKLINHMNPYRDNFFHHMIFSCNNFHSIAQQLQASRVESLDSASAPLNNFVGILANCFRAVN